MIEINLLFIYGTLLPVFENSWSIWLKNNTEPISEGYMPGLLYLVSNYPGALYYPEISSKVAGLILKMDDPPAILKKLDEYEEADGRFGDFDEYKRQVVEIYGLDGIIRSCWTYLYNRNVGNLNLISSGDFITYYFSNI